MQKQRSLLQGRLNGLYYELPVKIQGWETDFQAMKFLCSARAGFSCYINTLAAQMTQNPDAYDSGRLELFNRSYTGQISGDRYFGLVNSIRDGSMSAFGTFPFGMPRSLIPRLAKFHMVFQINEFVDLKPGGP